MERFVLTDVAQLKEADLNSFCPTKFFHIAIAIDPEHTNLVNKFADLKRHSEDVTSLIFITSDDILRFRDIASDVAFPNHLQPVLLTVAESAKRFSSEEPMPVALEAQLLKLKIIKLMFDRHVEETNRYQKKRDLEDTLNMLSKECTKITQPKEANSKNKWKPGENKSLGKSDIDLTALPPETGSLFAVDSIFDHVSFFILTGFERVEIIDELIVNLDVPIVKVMQVCNEPNADFELNWQRHLVCPAHRHLENTIFMKFVPQSGDLLEVLQDFLFVSRSVVDIKLTHLNYIRHLKLHKVRKKYNTIPIGCLVVYDQFMENIPLECSSEFVILDALIRELKFRSGHRVPSVCKEIETTKSVPNFLTHESNLLKVAVKCYGQAGNQLFHSTMTILKLFPLFSACIKQPYVSCDMTHTHDVGPCTPFKIQEKEVLDHFTHLFLFNILKRDKPPIPVNHNLTFSEYLDTYTPMGSDRSERTEPSSNSYQTPILNFLWTEKIGEEVMIQELFKATSEFNYVLRKYFPETDNFLFIFTDRLDDFGTNIEFFDIAVRTPVCLRDFCRYTTVIDAKWLQDNALKSLQGQKSSTVRETCPGVDRVKTMKLFEEYSYLLDVDLNDSNEDRGSSRTDLAPIYEDLLQYHSGKDLKLQCGSLKLNKLLGYDLGSRLIRLVGTKTTFMSHDGVKITVDNSRLDHTEEKCTIKVLCDECTLTLHSRKSLVGQMVTNVVLKDGSKLSFAFGADDRDLNEHSSELRGSTPNETEDGSTATEPDLTQYYVYSVDEEYFNRMIGTSSAVEEISVCESEGEFLRELESTMDEGGTVYKVTKDSKFLERKLSVVKIPLLNILGAAPPQTEPYKKFSRRLGGSDVTEETTALSFRICLPNGLFIQAPAVDGHVTIVKQEYTSKKPLDSNVDCEEFRLFTNQGFVLIKNVDGTIRILKCNGDVVDLDHSESDSRRRKTDEDIRKESAKMFGKHQGDNCISRRGLLKTKRNTIADERMLDLLKAFDVPYPKKRVTTFDGRKIKIKGDKMSLKQTHHLIVQQDFVSENIYLERSDGLKSLFRSDGSKEVVFSDGTSIVSYIDVVDGFEDDFVFVMMSFQYDHANYATVRYDFDKTYRIDLKDVVLKGNGNDAGYTLETAENICVSVLANEILFRKTCSKCDGVCKCAFNMKPFQDRYWTPNGSFMVVEDSYGKRFRSDFVGNCSKDPEYIETESNRFGCNHCANKTYHKLFVVNRNLSGELFWDHDSLASDSSLSKRYEVTRYQLPFNPKIEVLEWRRNVFENYRRRFFNRKRLERNNKSNIPCYTTSRMFYKMISKDSIKTLLKDMQRSYSMTNFAQGDDIVMENIADLVRQLEECDRRESGNIVELGKDTKTAKDSSGCPCSKKKMTISEKINKWREERSRYRRILANLAPPKYFDSEFCQVRE